MYGDFNYKDETDVAVMDIPILLRQHFHIETGPPQGNTMFAPRASNVFVDSSTFISRTRTQALGPTEVAHDMYVVYMNIAFTNI